MKFLFTLLISISFSNALFAQDDPGQYIGAIDNARINMDKTYMAYLSAVAHSGRVRKIEKMRQQTIESITNCKYALIDLSLYKGDNSLRKSSISYVDIIYKVFNEDYAHIVNLEDIAEQSYNEMEAYILLKEKTNEKIDSAAKAMSMAVDSFAAKYNVKLINTTDELSEKMETASKLNKYYDKVYLLFFKCNWEDNELTDAMNKKDLINIEQARTALISYANEGLKALDTLRTFQGDPALYEACKEALTFYKTDAETNIPKMTDFILKEQNFEKFKDAFAKKGNAAQADVDAYNKEVNNMNAAANSFNQLNETVNNNRNHVIQNWDTTEKSFDDLHMPYYK